MEKVHHFSLVSYISYSEVIACALPETNRNPTIAVLVFSRKSEWKAQCVLPCWGFCQFDQLHMCFLAVETISLAVICMGEKYRL